MRQLRSLRQQLFDIRPNEHLRVWSMFFYLLSVLFAYYIVKPVSRAMFLTRFDVDKLPSLYILIAIAGGFLAYFYSKLATKTSLRTAVLWATVLWTATLVLMWWLIRMKLPWMIYVLNIWVSLFSIVTVSQGWLVASNIFDTREAKRLYPLLGMGMVLGAASGGEFTNRTAVLVGTENLLLASAVLVIIAYGCFRLAVWKAPSQLQGARAAQKDEVDFSFAQMFKDIGRVRHLQIIVGMMVVMYLVDTLVEYQFQAMARTAYRGDQLTAFFGQFYGIYLNGVEFLFQLFVTGLVVHWFGVGGTLHVSPVAIILTSAATFLVPGVKSASLVRLTEASTRYTLNKTGLELLYMPLPIELRNRIKAFIDICVDRLSRGVAGVMLLVLTGTWFHLGVRGLSVVVVALCIPWIFFSHLARREYVATIRRRLEARRLDLETARITVSDAATIRLLETTAQGENPRQAVYALGLLAEAPRYDIERLLGKLADSAVPEVRAQVYEIAARAGTKRLLDRALRDLRQTSDGGPDVPALVHYLITVSEERASLAKQFLRSDSLSVVRAALESFRDKPDLAADLIEKDWLDRMADSGQPQHRALAALAVGVRGDQGTEVLHRLMEDSDVTVVAAACRAAAGLGNRAYLFPLVKALGQARLRGDAIAALTSYGPVIAGSLADVLLDENLPRRVRTQIPRVLRNLPSQRTVDILLPLIKQPDIAIRNAVLKALNRLRETAPELNFENSFVTEQILAEARYYCELSAALARFREYRDADRPAAKLLARTIEERVKKTLERLFRLLGLRYPPKEIYSAYLAVAQPRSADSIAAVEFLDSILERNLKRTLLPLLDAPDHLLERGQELFGIEIVSTEEAVRLLIRSRDPWVVACAMASAAELDLRSLTPDIAQAAEESLEDVSAVARSAQASLAA
jgi:ATP/ADP translocase